MDASKEQLTKEREIIEELKEEVDYLKDNKCISFCKGTGVYSRENIRLKKQVERHQDFYSSIDPCPNCGWVGLCFPEGNFSKKVNCHLDQYLKTGVIPKEQEEPDYIFFRCSVAKSGECNLTKCEFWSPNTHYPSEFCILLLRNVSMEQVEKPEEVAEDNETPNYTVEIITDSVIAGQKDIKIIHNVPKVGDYKLLQKNKRCWCFNVTFLWDRPNSYFHDLMQLKKLFWFIAYKEDNENVLEKTRTRIQIKSGVISTVSGKGGRGWQEIVKFKVIGKEEVIHRGHHEKTI